MIEFDKFRAIVHAAYSYNSYNEQKKLYLFISEHYNTETFKYLGTGVYAKVFEIDDNLVLRISRHNDLPEKIPNSKYINKMLGEKKIMKLDEYSNRYFSVHPKLESFGQGFYPVMYDWFTQNLELQKELKRVRKYLKKQFKIKDLHDGNFGLCSETGLVKLLDLGYNLEF